MKRRIMIVAVLVGLLIGQAGCFLLLVGAGAGIGGYAYAEGELSRTYNAPVKRAYDACVEVLKSMKMAVKGAKQDALGGDIVAHRADGTVVRVQLKAMGAEQTKVGVRIGNFGDKEQSMAIHDKINARLQ